VVAVSFPLPSPCAPLAVLFFFSSLLGPAQGRRPSRPLPSPFLFSSSARASYPFSFFSSFGSTEKKKKVDRRRNSVTFFLLFGHRFPGLFLFFFSSPAATRTSRQQERDGKHRQRPFFFFPTLNLSISSFFFPPPFVRVGRKRGRWRGSSFFFFPFFWFWSRFPFFFLFSLPSLPLWHSPGNREAEGPFFFSKWCRRPFFLSLPRRELSGQRKRYVPAPFSDLLFFRCGPQRGRFPFLPVFSCTSFLWWR